MLRKVIVKKLEITVNNYSIIEKIFRNKIFKTLKINDNFILSKRDKIIFICYKCKKELIESFFYNEKFLEKNIICHSCNKKKMFLEKYGMENPSQLQEIKEKKKETCLARYGVENPSQLQKTKEKKKETCLARYGVEYYINRNKCKKTCLMKYGIEHYTNNNKRNKTIENKYNVKNSFQIKSVKEKNKIKILSKSFDKYFKLENIIPLFTIEKYLKKENKYDKFIWQCKTCNTEFEGYYENGKEPRCPTCFPYTKSIREQELSNWCKILGEVIENDRTIIKPYEIDIYLPDYKLAIEYNGLYWHSIKFIQDKWYHQRKVELAYRQGIRLLHVWEHEDLEDIKKTIYYYINSNDSIKVKKPKLYNINNNLIWI